MLSVVFMCTTDQPFKLEKTRMAEAIITAFPVLKMNGGGGYVSSAE
jgi:hypothetical protein